MPGHMGHTKITTLNLKVVSVDADLGVVMVKGAVPGAEGGYVYIRDAVKRARPKEAPLPAGLKVAQQVAS
jgi:large subunit ribosomal protein L3